jgi:hypothetical protein
VYLLHTPSMSSLLRYLYFLFSISPSPSSYFFTLLSISHTFSLIYFLSSTTSHFLLSLLLLAFLQAIGVSSYDRPTQLLSLLHHPIVSMCTLRWMAVLLSDAGNTHTHTHTCVHVHVHIHRRLDNQTRTHAGKSFRTHTHTLPDTHTLTHTHTNTHTHTHTHTNHTQLHKFIRIALLIIIFLH